VSLPREGREGVAGVGGDGLGRGANLLMIGRELDRDNTCCGIYGGVMGRKKVHGRFATIGGLYFVPHSGKFCGGSPTNEFGDSKSDMALVFVLIF
jgi:hypothetical protein